MISHVKRSPFQRDFLQPTKCRPGRVSLLCSVPGWMEEPPPEVRPHLSSRIRLELVDCADQRADVVLQSCLYRTSLSVHLHTYITLHYITIYYITHYAKKMYVYIYIYLCYAKMEHAIT